MRGALPKARLFDGYVDADTFSLLASDSGRQGASLGCELDVVTVFILAHGSLSRGGISAMVSSQPCMRVLGEAKDVQSIRVNRAAPDPDVLILYLNDGCREAFESIEEARKIFYRCPVLLVIKDLSPGGARKALSADVAGAISEDVSVETLIESIRKVKDGQRVIGPDVAVLGSVTAPNPLTPRETEILGLAAEGEDPEETAGHLHLSPGTVRNHLLSAVQKVGARNRLDAVRIARRRGWL
ncbi:response regulator transcription factor [Streptomyces olivoreticuli]|uniref:helix-turn-helix transcriptional regulator n=1 Tax=Streptomyces olivoreticuli TaxID=68246 RepID=UPI002659D21C|nr:response regulator transcription factor [Streptomyces olivoreticuli]WKK26611.1 response regulator transcription factor [Streptomyces olivoreticuli]